MSILAYVMVSGLFYKHLIKSFIKPTDTFQYLHRISAHPFTCFKSFIIGETTRHIRNTNNPNDFSEIIENFKSRLLQRGYTASEVNQYTQSVDHTTRKSLLVNHNNKSNKQVPLAFVTTFNPRIIGIKNILLKHWNIIENDKKNAHLFPNKPIVVYKRNRNIGEIITKSKI